MRLCGSAWISACAWNPYNELFHVGLLRKGACAKTVKTALEQSDLYDKKRKMAPLRGGASVFRFKNAFVNHVEGGLVVVPVNSLHAVEQAVRHWADSKDETKNPAINQSGSPAELTNSDSNPQVVLGETAGVRKKSRTRKKSKTGLVSLCEIAAHYRSFDDVAHSSKGVVEWQVCCLSRFILLWLFRGLCVPFSWGTVRDFASTQMACKIVFIGCSSSSECFEGAGDLPTNLRCVVAETASVSLSYSVLKSQHSSIVVFMVIA